GDIIFLIRTQHWLRFSGGFRSCLDDLVVMGVVECAFLFAKANLFGIAHRRRRSPKGPNGQILASCVRFIPEHRCLRYTFHMTPTLGTMAGEAIPLLNLAAQYPALETEIREALERVLGSQQFVLGREGEALEEEIARLCGAAHGVAVASGTDALMLALRACGVGAGDEVLLPPFTFVATGSAVSALGAKPVFTDIHPNTYALHPSELERRITARTRAIIAVHLYGLSADMDPIVSFARSRGLPVIEDNAQAIGAAYKGRPTGSLGDVACLSFYPTKNLGAYGDAGMIVTNSAEMTARLRALRNHGQTGKYVSSEPGWNSRLDELQATILRVKLRHL